MAKKITGRTKQLSLKTTPKFHAKLKELAVKEKCLMIEVLEKAVAVWEEQRKKNKESTMVWESVAPIPTKKHSRIEDEEEGLITDPKKRRIDRRSW